MRTPGAAVALQTARSQSAKFEHRALRVAAVGGVQWFPAARETSGISKLDRKQFQQLRQGAGRAHGGVVERGFFSPHQLQIGGLFPSSSAVGKLMGEGTQMGT